MPFGLVAAARLPAGFRRPRPLVRLSSQSDMFTKVVVKVVSSLRGTRRRNAAGPSAAFGRLRGAAGYMPQISTLDSVRRKTFSLQGFFSSRSKITRWPVSAAQRSM